MRVLHVFKTYLPDSFTGIERVIHEIAEATAPLGVETEVLSLSRNPRSQPLSVDSHVAYSSRRDLQVYSTGLSLSVFRDYRRLAARADLVHYHFPWPMMDVVHLASGVKRPNLVTYHSDIVRQRIFMPVYRPLMNAFLRSVDRVVATSQNYFESSDVLRTYRDKAEVIPLGIKDMAPPDPALVEDWRRRIGEPFFLFVGKLRYYKGLEFLAEAARRTGHRVLIIGNGQMYDVLCRADVANIDLLGPLCDTDKEALLSLCHAFVFPSHLRAEAFGVSLLEAARAGKPMISCELGTGTSYVNAHGETGLVIPPADPAALAEAMTTLWNDEALARRFGAAARRRYEQKFRAVDMGAAYAALYRRLLGDQA
jgi:glycosyltransferase involved in cell wall biosynthesis